MTYALIQDGVVWELFPAKPVLNDALKVVDVSSVAGIAVGWSANSDGTFSAPPPPAVTSADLIAYAASARYLKETSGITVNGIKVDTSRDSQALITGAWATTQQTPSATIQWKAADGTWSTLTAAQMQALAEAVSSHVQACFAAEQQVDEQINASPPTITTTAQIDAAFAALTD